jgi:hypothetical protein
VREELGGREPAGSPRLRVRPTAPIGPAQCATILESGSTTESASLRKDTDMSEISEPSRLSGEPLSRLIVVFPTDPRYDGARLRSNLRSDQHPPVIAVPRTVAELDAVVDYASLLDLRVELAGADAGALPGDLSGTVLVDSAGLAGVRLAAAADRR